MIETPIQLVVGLGNPGKTYAETRHNAGAWLVIRLAELAGVDLKLEPKFHGHIALISADTHKFRLLIPTTFMNHSGQAVRAVAQFYQIPPEAILVAHDELDFPAGVARIKQDGGHGGHNGLRSIIEQLGAKNFHRARIGIGHPGHRSLVHDYVLSRPSSHDHNIIIDAIQQVINIMPALVSGQIQHAMQQLHTTIQENPP